MPLMGSLYVGASGLQTSQNALNTTAHNLSNLETTGYVRQQVLLGDRKYNDIGISAPISPQKTGLGVEFTKTRQVRDYFLDVSYRKEAGRGAFYDVCYETTNEVETLLGELNGAAFKDTLNNLWTAVEEMQKDPSSSVTQGQFVNVSAQFLERAQSVYDGIANYQDNINTKIKEKIHEINEIGEKICKLNEKILNVELGSETANDLRDQRNLLMDKLAGYMSYEYSEDADGVVEIRMEGQSFISRGKGEPFYMGYTVDSTNGFYTPVWPWAKNQEVYDCSEEISTAKNTNIGELKSLLLARGDRRANYTDLNNEYTDTVTGETVDLYNKGATGKMATANSIILNAMAEFDQLINSVTSTINNILAGEDKLINAGTNPTYAAGEPLPKELFVRIGTDRYTLNGAGEYEYVPEDTSQSPADVSTMYTISNLKINPELLKTPTLLGYPDQGFIKADKTVDQDKADALVDAFSAESLVLNPNVTKISTYKNYYSDLVGMMANSGDVYKSFSDAQELTVDSLDDSRHQIMGVDSNEELSNMIKFQNAFNASSRYINTVSEMLEHLLTRLGGG